MIPPFALPAKTSLLTLPPELRDCIYSYLSPRTPLHTKSISNYIGVSSISHSPPPVNFILVCKQIHYEATEAYYRKATFKIQGLLDSMNPWAMWDLEEVLAESKDGKVVLGKVRRIEVGLFWAWLPQPTFKRVSGENEEVEEIIRPREEELMRRVERMRRAVDVLKKAGRLTVLTVTWKEVAPVRIEGVVEDAWEWDARRAVLEPLKSLAGVRVVEGDLIAGQVIEEGIRGLLRGMDRELPELVKSSDEAVCGAELGNGPVPAGKYSHIELPQGEGQWLRTPEDQGFNIMMKRSYFD